MTEYIMYHSISTHIVNAQKPIEYKEKKEVNFKNKVTFEKGANNEDT